MCDREVMKKQEMLVFWGIICIAFAIRIAAAIVWEQGLDADQKFKFGDSAGYWHLAKQVANGDSYDYNSPYAKVFRTPGYPVFLSPLFWCFNEPPVMAARVIGALLGSISVGLVFQLARKLFDNRTGIGAGLLISLYPGAIATSVLVLAEALFVPIMLMQLLMAMYAHRASSRKGFALFALAAGVCYGLACLTRPSWILFVPFCFLIGVVFSRDRNKQIVFTAIVLAAMAVTMSPWWIRNYQVVGRFVPTSLQTGTSLYDGLNPTATGASDMRFAPIMKKEFLREWASQELPARDFEFAFNEKMKNESLAWAQQNPVKCIHLSFVKFVRMWSPLPNASEMGNQFLRWGIAIYFTPLLLISVWGLVRFGNHPQVVWVCLLPTVYFTLIHMVFVGSIRYRHPPMLTFAILAAAVLASWLSFPKAIKRN